MFAPTVSVNYKRKICVCKHCDCKLLLLVVCSHSEQACVCAPVINAEMVESVKDLGESTCDAPQQKRLQKRHVKTVFNVC